MAYEDTRYNEDETCAIRSGLEELVPCLAAVGADAVSVDAIRRLLDDPWRFDATGEALKARREAGSFW